MGSRDRVDSGVDGRTVLVVSSAVEVETEEVILPLGY